MAIWNRKNKKSAVAKVSEMAVKKTEGVKAAALPSLADVLLRPRITEKASILSGQNAYVFDISPRANRKEVAAAVFKKYGFKPIRVNITAIKAKKILSRRGTPGLKPGGKKAVVYLKKGDKIETV